MSVQQESKRQPILPTLKSPRELEKLSSDELNLLAAEIRNEICRLYDHRCVHFASNLGVVELSIALHSVFDFAHDRLIWDTGHQVYPHKLLTGRYPQFSTIRTKGGLMGFPNPNESEYDLMMTGHAGSSVGAVVGLCCGDDLLSGKDNRHSVAVIGDGAFSSGGVFEAMNHVGGLQKNITVVLNDNKMSICPRVGGLAEHLDNLRLHPRYSRFKQKLHSVVDRLPLIGASLDSFLRYFKDTMKAGLIGGKLFESLGFRYIGPIDGHDIARLQRFLRMARKLNEPVLLHVITDEVENHSLSAACNAPIRVTTQSTGRNTKSLVTESTVCSNSQKLRNTAALTTPKHTSQTAARAIMCIGVRRHHQSTADSQGSQINFLHYPYLLKKLNNLDLNI